MRNILLIAIAVILVLPARMAAQTSADRQHYRRSSLTLILLTHRDKKYAEDMERVFKSFPLPRRYNEHNIADLRVISVSGPQSRKKIEQMLANNHVAHKVVSRWFNRNPQTGRMNMDLIHERGGYGAFYDDYQRAQSNVLGTAMLRDEGIELLQSSFVLVCDMDYIEKQTRAKWGAVGLGLLSAMTAAYANTEAANAQRQAYNGNYKAAQNSMKNAQLASSAAKLGMAGAAIVADIGGFRVKMHSYLYQLRWDDAMTQTMFDSYWCDSDTPFSQAKTRRSRYNAAANNFYLDYVGEYHATSSKTTLRSWSNDDEVILDVCHRCVEKGMTQLAKTFPIFRPRTPFYFDGDCVYSHVGLKEDVSYGKRYEILQPYKDKRGVIQYRRVGVAKADRPWDNQKLRFDLYFDSRQKGTQFYCRNASIDLHTPGLQLREM